MAIYAKEGNVSVRMSDTLERIARRAVEQVVPGVLDRMERDTRGVGDEARDEWPVRTGQSRDGLQVRTVVDTSRNEVRSEVRNDVDYARFVRPSKLYGTTTAWAEYVQRPMRKLHVEFVRTLGPVIVAGLRGR